MSRSVGGTASGRAVTWAWELAHVPPSDAVRRSASRLLLDALGCAVAGARSGEVDHLMARSHRTIGSGPATLLDGSGQATVEDGALGNGLLLTCLDLDDRHAQGWLRAGASVLPAALAVAEQVDATGTDLLLAALAGIEVSCRLASAGGSGFRSHGFDVTPVVGVTASALSVARLRRLEPHVAQHAVGVAASLAAGRIDLGPPPGLSGVERLHAGTAARQALLAVDLASAGATGPADAWEGPTGLLASYADVALPADELVGDLGSHWELERVGIQRHPCSPLAQSAVDAAGSLATDGLRPDDVDELVVVAHPGAAGVVCRPTPAGEPVDRGLADPFADPRNPDEARRSLPWCVATTLVDGELTVGAFRPGRLRRPEVLDLVDRVRCELSEHVHGDAAAHPGHLRVRLADGEELAAMAPGGVGGADHPLGDDELVDRFVEHCGDRPGAAEVAARLLVVEDEPSVADLITDVAALAG